MVSKAVESTGEGHVFASVSTKAAQSPIFLETDCSKKFRVPLVYLLQVWKKLVDHI